MRRIKPIIFIATTVAIFFLLHLEFSKACTMILVIICFTFGSKEHNWYNPFYLLNVTLASYLLYEPSFSPGFFSVLSPMTVVMIVGGFVMLILGFYVAKQFKYSAINVGGHTESFWVVLTIGVIPVAISYYIYGNVLDMTGKDMLDTKGKISLPVIGQLAYFLPAAIIIACKKNDTKKILISLAFSLLSAFMTLTKTAFIVTLLFFLVGTTAFNPEMMEYKSVKMLRKFSYLWIPALVIFMFFYNNSIRHEASSSQSMNYIEQGNARSISSNGDFAENMFLNYLYFCSPWSNLEYNVHNNRERGHGRIIFAQFAKKAGITVKTVPKINPTFLNTHSFITDFYLDFGFEGALVNSFILGWIIFFFYRKFGCSNDPLLVSFYCLIAYATIMLFFSNHFTIGYLLNYFITFGGYYVIYRSLSWK